MPTELYECVNTYRDLMEAITKKSIASNREIGMLFHVDKLGKCTIGNICMGSLCCVYFPRGELKNSIGSFHVHALHGASSDLSHGDIASSYNSKHNFACVSSEKDGIKCFNILRTPETKSLAVMSDNVVQYLIHNVNTHLLKVVRSVSKLDRSVLDVHPDAEYIKGMIQYIKNNRNMPVDQIYDMYIDFHNYMVYIIDYLLSCEDKKRLQSTGIIYYIQKDMKNMINEHHRISSELEDFMQANESKMVQEHIL